MSNRFTFHLASSIIPVFFLLIGRAVSNTVYFYDFSLLKHIQFQAPYQIFSVVVQNSMATYYQLQKLFICHSNIYYPIQKLNNNKDDVGSWVPNMFFHIMVSLPGNGINTSRWFNTQYQCLTATLDFLCHKRLKHDNLYWCVVWENSLRLLYFGSFFNFSCESGKLLLCICGMRLNLCIGFSHTFVNGV